MLKYLFVAQFTDGSIFQQTQEDRSLCVFGGSAFSDIKDRDDIATFGLYSPETDKDVSVNLQNGRFDINGFEFINDDPDIEFPEGTKYRLVYFRRNTINFDANGVQDKSTVFYIGWQATVDGKNYKRVIGVQ
jgi:hypothetical protein